MANSLFTGQQGPQGDTGPTGPQGPVGPQGPSVDVRDEGVSLTTQVTVMDFVGDGVEVTEPATDQVEVSIPGGMKLAAEGSSLGVTQTGSGSYVNKFSYTTPSLPAGDYYVTWFMLFGCVGSDKRAWAKFRNDTDGVNLDEGGFDVKGATGESDMMSAASWISKLSGGVKVNWAADGAKTFKFQYKQAEGSNAIAGYARIYIWKMV